MAVQNIIKTQPSNQDYQELLVRLPVRDSSVWTPLQKKEFKSAMDRFYSILGYYTPETAKQIFWKGIIEGHPIIRGDVSYEEWLREVMPRLAVIVLNIADEKLFERIYRSLNTATLIYFNSLLTEEIPGLSDEEKIDFLSEKKPWLKNFLFGSPLNAMGGLFFEANKNASFSISNVTRRIEILPTRLKGALFSIATCNAISSICEKEGLSNQQSTNVSHLLGLTLIGLMDSNELGERIEKACDITQEKSLIFAEKLKNILIDPYQNDIASLKEQSNPIIKEQEISVPIKTTDGKTEEKQIKINKVEFPSIGEEKSSENSGNAPFILHKEKDLTAGASGASPFKKGSVFSFGFFKPRGTPITEKKEISVKIESSEKPIEKNFSSAPVSTSIFEQIKTELEDKNKEVLPSANQPLVEKVQGTPPAPLITLKTEDAKASSKPTVIKQVHYSAFKTDLPPDDKVNPHVNGNTVFFK